MSYIKPL